MPAPKKTGVKKDVAVKNYLLDLTPQITLLLILTVSGYFRRDDILDLFRGGNIKRQRRKAQGEWKEKTRHCWERGK